MDTRIVASAAAAVAIHHRQHNGCARTIAEWPHLLSTHPASPTMCPYNTAWIYWAASMHMIGHVVYIQDGALMRMIVCLATVAPDIDI